MAKKFTVYVEAKVKIELAIEHEAETATEAIEFAETQVRQKMAELNPKRVEVRATKVGVTNYEVKRIRRTKQKEEESADVAGD